MGTPRIYCDMDGVLVDFAEGAKSYLKIDPKTQAAAFNTVWGSSQGWAKLMHDLPTFWMDLPELSQTQRLWQLIKPFHPSILTAIPEGWRSAGAGKYVWVKRHLPKFGYHRDEEFHAVMRSEKQRFAKQADGTPNLLIDDYIKNIREWTAAGGIGVQYTDDSNGLTSVKRALFALGLKTT